MSRQVRGRGMRGAIATPFSDPVETVWNPMVMTTITVRMARRLALCRAGMLKPEWAAPIGGRDGNTGRSGAGERALRRAAHAVIDRFGYLQLDTVSVAGARSHAIILMSRLPRFGPELGESLLMPGEPLFEYWGHEVCWLPLSLYPVMGWRRRRIRHHPWWGDVIGTHPELAEAILKRIRDDGPLKSSDLEGSSGKGWWNHKPAKTVAVALWSSGELAVRERRAFQRSFDLPERVIPEEWLATTEPPLEEALETLLLKALEGHGWAQTGTLARTWRLRLMKDEIDRALKRLVEAGAIVACAMNTGEEGRVRGWIRPADLELAVNLEKVRPAYASPVLLSPFDPLLWDRDRVRRLFGVTMTIEIFVPADRRTYGYYCLPVLAGERLVARVDLKAERKTGELRVVSCHAEPKEVSCCTPAEGRALARKAVDRYARQVGLAARWK
jgi:uncharacterized protein